jgi:hypothetical protein
LGAREVARAALEVELPHLDAAGALNAALPKLEARFAAWLILKQAGDPRAARHLRWAIEDLNSVADRLSSAPEREHLLHGVALHRELVLAWQASTC